MVDGAAEAGSAPTRGTTVGSIVVGVDGSETAEIAAREAARLAEGLGATLHLVTGYHRSDPVEVAGGGSDRWHIDARSIAEQLVKDVAGRLSYHGDYRTSVREGKPADVILETARADDASYIVVGNRRVTGAGRVLGSVATAVLHHAPCSVVVAKTT